MPRRSALDRLGARPPRRLDVERRRNRVTNPDSGSNSAYAIRIPRRRAELRRSSTSTLSSPPLHLGVLRRRRSRLLVDQEQPAAARVDRIAVEVQRQLAQPLARVDRHPHHLGVRVVAAHDGSRLARRGLAERARLEQQRRHVLARQLPQRRGADDPAADDDRLVAVHFTLSIVL
jgi:hypothetical protein